MTLAETSDNDPIARLLRPLADALGVGLDGRLGTLLLPPGWVSQVYTDGGMEVTAGGRSSTSPPGAWGMGCAVVLADDLWDRSEHYGALVLRRADAEAGLWAGPCASPATLRPLLRATAAALLLNGWASAPQEPPCTP